MLKETKKYFEDLFNDNWTATPIHFGGQEFNAENIPQWINPTVQPLRNTATGINGSMMYSFFVYVVCWAETDVDCMDLADSVAGFMSANIGDDYSTVGYNIIDHGWQDSNSVFTVMSFECKTYGGDC